MKNPSSIAAAFGLVLLWAAMLFIVPSFMSQFAGFKVEMPALTMTTVLGFRFMGGLALPLLVLLTAILLSYRQVAGWALALTLCVGYDLVCLGLFMPYISLMNNLSGGDALTPAPPTNPINSTVVILLGCTFLLNQLLFIALLVKRRDFVGYNQPDANGKISYT